MTSELEEQTELGDVYLDGLLRAQLRLSLTVGGIALAALLGLPLLLVGVPGTRTLSFLGIPFPWLALTAGVFPGLWALAYWYTRQAERIEADFVDAVGRD